jgi:serine phosphatase RsbU (regulator of sigma subunit)
VSLDGAAVERLRAIVGPFGGTDAGISISIEDADGIVLASAGVVATDAGLIETRHQITVGADVIGRVVGRGTVDRGLLEAIAGSVAAGVEAFAEASVAGEDAARASEADGHRLEAELALGRRIQRSFVPLIPPDIEGYEVASHYEAAREVGGDFFDVFRIRGRSGHLAICIADVTGKGIAAALLMAFARPLLHSAIEHVRTPGEALERTNRILVEERRSALFITALCAFVELRSGVLRLANAGHEPPLVVPAGDGPIAWLEGSGPLLGAFATLDLAECSVTLAPGDLVLLYTDGVTDARAASGERFGDDRLVEALSASRGGAAAEVVDAVCDAYHRFQGAMPAADDVTIVAIRRNPRPARSGSSRSGGAAREAQTPVGT